MKPFVIIPLILYALSSSIFAATVAYVRDLTFPSGPPSGFLLPLTKAPIDTSDPLYDPDLPDTQRMVFARSTGAAPISYSFDPATGIVSTPIILVGTKVDETSLIAQSGVETSVPMLQIIGFRNGLYRYNLDLQSTVGSDVPIAMGVKSSLAMATRTNMTAIGQGAVEGNDLFSINMTTGAASLAVAIAGGTGPGEFSTETRYHAYGPDGLVYLLDYGNDRMQMLDPENDFAFAGEFALGPDVANMQFTIGPTGNIYFGDALGGGSYYSATGDFLGVFSLDTPVDPTLAIGTPYLSADATGGVYVFDDTGFHQYLDTSVIPEPSVAAMLIGGGGLFAAFARRRYRKE